MPNASSNFADKLGSKQMRILLAVFSGFLLFLDFAFIVLHLGGHLWRSTQFRDFIPFNVFDILWLISLFVLLVLLSIIIVSCILSKFQSIMLGIAFIQTGLYCLATFIFSFYISIILQTPYGNNNVPLKLLNAFIYLFLFLAFIAVGIFTFVSKNNKGKLRKIDGIISVSAIAIYILNTVLRCIVHSYFSSFSLSTNGFIYAFFFCLFFGFSFIILLLSINYFFGSKEDKGTLPGEYPTCDMYNNDYNTYSNNSYY